MDRVEGRVGKAVPPDLPLVVVEVLPVVGDEGHGADGVGFSHPFDHLVEEVIRIEDRVVVAVDRLLPARGIRRDGERPLGGDRLVDRELFRVAVVIVVVTAQRVQHDEEPVSLLPQGRLQLREQQLVVGVVDAAVLRRIHVQERVLLDLHGDFRDHAIVVAVLLLVGEPVDREGASLENGEQ